MTSGQYLRHATSLLESASIPSARLDSLIIMEYVLNSDRAHILANLDVDISVKQKKLLNELIQKRLTHLPVAYIVQYTYFYGRRFIVNEHVLVPRPESETMIEAFKWIVNNNKDIKFRCFQNGYIQIADVGSGCGALGITASLESPQLKVDLIDVDIEALKVAKSNVVFHTLELSLLKADILPKNNTNYDILLCNLPYVPDDFAINLAAGHEPRTAIFGGKDGLNIYRKLFKVVSLRQQKPLYILCESLPPSHKQLAAIAMRSNYILEATDDFIQIFKLAK